MRNLNIRPDTGVYGTYKRISYEPRTALAEFVDNSTQSFYDHEEELYNTKYYKGLEIEIIYTEDAKNGDEIVIKDNAYGMDYSDFQRAIILDRPPLKTNGRNEFGMGLKAAACWFGNLWSVETTMLGQNCKYKAEIDVDNLVKYKNEEIIVEDEPASPKDHYTIITIKRLNKKIKGKRIEKKIHELLSSIYRVDLRTGKIKIYYNEQPLKFDEVEPYTDEKGHTWKKDVSFSLPYKDGEVHVNGFIGIRVPGSTVNAGFTLLRRGRVIVGGPDKNYRPREVFGPSNLYTYQRMYGELNMDDWPVTQAKDGFDWSNEDLEAKFIEKLIEFSKDYHEFAENLRTREKVSVRQTAEELQTEFKNNKNIEDAHFYTKTSKESTDDSQINANNTDISDIQIDNEDLINESAGTGVEIIKDDDNGTFYCDFIYKNVSYNITYVFDDTNPMSTWLRVEFDENNENKFIIRLNVRQSFFFPFIQKKDFLKILAKFTIAMVIAEIRSKDVSSDGKIDPSYIRMETGRILEDLKPNE